MQPPRKPTILEIKLLESDYSTINTVEDLPKGLRALIAPEPHPIANPGEPYNETDLVSDDDTRQRFVVGGKNNKTAFALYEQGGFVPITVLIIAHIDGDNVINYCRFMAKGLPTTTSGVKSLVPDKLIKWSGYKCQ